MSTDPLKYIGWDWGDGSESTGVAVLCGACGKYGYCGPMPENLPYSCECLCGAVLTIRHEPDGIKLSKSSEALVDLRSYRFRKDSE